MTNVFLRDDLRSLWGDEGLFDRVLALEGETYRVIANRRTLRFEAAGRAYFAKLHRGVGWGEILKNLAVLRRPVLSARNEFETCRQLASCGIRAPTVAAFGERGRNPARRESFVICDALEGFESLEDLTAGWSAAPPRPAEQRALVMAVARFARRFHESGIVHRDFYLCHLLLDVGAWRAGRIELAVLDLHRARHFQRLPDRWRGRDLAALLFSCLELPLGRRSWLRFVRVYTGRPLREVYAREGRFWRRVERRAHALYRKGLRKGIVRGDYRP
jgi:heptose I phosphotransferase